eukprot:11550481-Prorocentrum_lima.AAC.1
MPGAFQQIEVLKSRASGSGISPLGTASKAAPAVRPIMLNVDEAHCLSHAPFDIPQGKLS